MFDNVQNLLCSNQSLTWRTAPKCPKCYQLYTSSYVKQGYSRRAFILKCDHLMCERCILEQARSPAHSAVCKVCSIRTLLNPRERISEQLQHSYQMLGFLYQRQHEVSRLATVLPDPQAPGNEKAGDEFDKECYECNLTRTRSYCQECDTPLCRDCFEKIHRVGKVLSKHKMCSLTAKKWLRDDVSICEEHKLTTVLYCANCQQRVCYACRSEAHSMHSCVEIVNINKEMKPNLELLIKDLEQAYAMNEQGRKNAERVLHKQKEYADKVITEITDYFFSLHNVLQSVEQELLVSVKSNFQKLHTETSEAQKALFSTERDLKRSLDQFKSFQTTLPKQVLLADLITDMKKMLHTTPVTAHFIEPSESPFSFRQRDPLRKEIHNYFELTCKSDGYRCKFTPFYLQEHFPALEPPSSQSIAKQSNTDRSTSGKSERRQSSSSVKSANSEQNMDISSISSGQRSPEVTLVKTVLSEKTQAKSPDISKPSISRASSQPKTSQIDITKESPHISVGKATPQSKSSVKSPEVQIVGTYTAKKNYQKGGNQNTKPGFGGRTKAQSASASITSASTSQHHPSIPPADAPRDASTNRKPSLDINPINPDNASFIKFSQKVNVTCVESPHKFFVQNQCFRSIVNELCQDEGKVAPEPKDIKPGELYLAQPMSERRWYRAKVLRKLKHGKKYEVIFIDYGRREDIPRQQILTLSEDLKEFSPGAYECTLYDIQPVDGKKGWSSEARQIMIDFIDNKQLIMYLVENNEDNTSKPMQVDLILQSIDSPKSLRKALVYLNLAKIDPKPAKRTEDSKRKIEQLEKTMQKWMSEYKRRIASRELEKDDVFRAKVLYSCSPYEFYIRKATWQDQFLKMQRELDQYCNKEAKIAYQPHVGMVCAFVEQDADEGMLWKRGRVLKVAEAHCEIASVDTGHRLLIPWQDIRYIPKQLIAQPAFAVCCKLIHIQPFKQHNYRWTEEALREFNRIANSSSVFQIIVVSEPDLDRSYEVALYIIRKYSDTCVNALMVKNGFAVSTGTESAVVERSKEVVEEQQPLINLTQESSGKGTLNRTSDSKSVSSKKQQNRVRVDILRVVSPSEFYVSLLKTANAVDRMQEEIQNKMDERMEEGDEKTSWKQGELCLVFPTSTTGLTTGGEAVVCEWYRARVIEVVDESNYTVFLIDKALTLNSHYSNMAVIPTELKQVHPAAIRCFLACIGPTGNQQTWSASVIDAFRVAIEKFEFYAISLHGRGINDTLPVILWGLTAENTKALSPQLFQYTNINNNLVQYGYVHLKEKFLPVSSGLSVEDELRKHYQVFEKFMADLDINMGEPSVEASLTETCESYQEDINDEATPIDRWLPPKPIDKTIFVATPTYVDNNGVIYLHDQDKEPILEALKKTINAKFEGSVQMPSDKFYSNGEPCLARFALDEQFYRAVVRKAISPTCYKVQFVDYGNVEECDVKDLRKNVICGRVPTMANKYRLSDVGPKKDTWETDVLDVMHALIVGKKCLIRVDGDMDTDASGVVPCFVKLTGDHAVELSEYLLKENLVENKRVVFEEKVDPLYDPYSSIVKTEEASSSPQGGRVRIAANFETVTKSESKKSDSIDLSPPGRDAGRISQRELDDLFEYVAAEQTRIAEREDGEDDNTQDATGLDLNKVRYFYSYGDIKEDEMDDVEDGELSEDEKKSDDNANGGSGTDGCSNISFNPQEFDTSTQLDPPLELTRPTLHGYPQFELDSSIKGFYCEVTNLVNPFNLFVFPQLDDHVLRMKEMMARIQCYARKHKKCSDIEEQMPCLALYKEDGFWYRGVIEEYFPETAEVRIFYVDYLNKEKISVRDILKCPVSLRRIPLRNVQVQLHALRSNPRLRETDVMHKLVDLIEGKKLYAKVLRYIPTLEVELYTDSTCSDLIYHRLIKEKYFLVGDEASASSSSRRKEK